MLRPEGNFDICFSDAPSEGAELPLAIETSSSSSEPPTAKVRRNSCHYFIKNDVCDIRREFVRTNKTNNFVLPSIPQQTPPAIRVHLVQLVGRIGKREKSKGKKITEISLKVPHLSQTKVMTSLSSREEKVEERDSLVLHKGNKVINNSEIGLEKHKGANMNHNIPALGLKNERKEQEVESRREQPKSYDVMDDDIMTSSDTTDNTSESRGDKLVAKKSQQEGKNILLYSVKDFLKWLLISLQTSFLVVLLLTTVTNVTNGLVNIRPQERITLIGNSADFLSAVVNSSTVFLSFLLMIQLHKLAILTAICIGLGLYLHVESLEKPCGRPKGGIKKLHNTRIREKKIGPSDNFCGYVRPMMQHLAGSVLAGKCLCAYIFLYTHFYATRIFNISKYTVNLGLGDNYQALIDLIYLYIYIYIYM